MRSVHPPVRIVAQSPVTSPSPGPITSTGCSGMPAGIPVPFTSCPLAGYRVKSMHPAIGPPPFDTTATSG